MKKREIVALILLVVLDQLTKYAAVSHLAAGQRVEILRNFFYLRLVYNTGAAWSILEGQMTFFYILTSLMLVAFIWYLWKTDRKETWVRWALVLIIAGTVGNFIDRIAFRQVTDFLDFYIFGYDFPVFNIADSELCIGAALFAACVLFGKEKKEAL